MRVPSRAARPAAAASYFLPESSRMGSVRPRIEFDGMTRTRLFEHTTQHALLQNQLIAA
jgi:hypothetical protein